MINNWELSVGFYPGILLGFRSYFSPNTGVENHVLYIPFLDICLTMYKEINEEE